MKMRAGYATWLLPFFLTGCFFKFHKQPVQVLAPATGTSPKPTVVHVDLPASATTIPEQPMATDANVEQEPIPPPKHRRAPKTVQQAAIAPPAPEETSGVSAIGQLSTGDPSDLRRQTEESIVETDRGLNGLGRKLNAQEQKTAKQIKEYLKQAREALVANDVDGAHTLAAKAKVLLGELSQ